MKKFAQICAIRIIRLQPSQPSKITPKNTLKNHINFFQLKPYHFHPIFRGFVRGSFGDCCTLFGKKVILPNNTRTKVLQNCTKTRKLKVQFHLFFGAKSHQNNSLKRGIKKPLLRL